MKALNIILTLCVMSAFWLMLVSCRRQSANINSGKTTKRNVQTVSVSRGKSIYDETGCTTCHSIGEVGGTIGPKLDGIGKKYDEDKLKQILLNPQTLNPNTTMPAFEGSEEDLNDLVAYLKSLK